MTIPIAVVYAAGLIGLSAIACVAMLSNQQEAAWGCIGVIASLLGYGGGRAWTSIEGRRNRNNLGVRKTEKNCGSGNTGGSTTEKGDTNEGS